MLLQTVFTFYYIVNPKPVCVNGLSSGQEKGHVSEHGLFPDTKEYLFENNCNKKGGIKKTIVYKSMSNITDCQVVFYNSALFLLCYFLHPYNSSNCAKKKYQKTPIYIPFL